MKYYFDTCIWRDYFENRTDKFRPLGEWALRLINKIIEEEGVFLYSDSIITELKNAYTDKEIDDIFSIIPAILLFKVETSEKQFKEAIMISKRFKMPLEDALHAILARDNNSIIVTRDKHFFELQQQITIKKPEELI